jgi:Ca-activated chloride channel family protein
MVLNGAGDTTLGVWIDTPTVRARVRPKVDLALVIDTSGSMGGAKIANARGAALALLDSLHDGDIVSVDTFADDAHALVMPTVISAATRARIKSIVSELGVGGSTNMFDGLSLAESQVARAPATHAVRRVVLLSDGQANVGPSSPEALGLLAERGLSQGAQVTSLGVGIDYDERTLNALAVRSSGRLYHLGNLDEMASILRREMDLLGSTVASDAFVEVVPAPGVRLSLADGARSAWAGGGTVRIPLGVLFGGQHREALVRVHFEDAASVAGGAPRPIASVRLHFRDPNEGDLDRVQEVIARVQTTDDSGAVAAHMSGRTHAIMAVQDAARLEMQAAQQVNGGQFGQADDSLAVAQKKLESEAKSVHDEPQRRRLAQAAADLASTRATTAHAAAAPAAVQRDRALELNSAGMHASGF